MKHEEWKKIIENEKIENTSLEDIQKLLDSTIDSYVDFIVLIKNNLETIQQMLQRLEQKLELEKQKPTNLDNEIIKRAVENLEQELGEQGSYEE